PRPLATSRTLASASATRCVSVCLLTPPAPPAFHTLSLHDALPISNRSAFDRAGADRDDRRIDGGWVSARPPRVTRRSDDGAALRSEEHTSELQSHLNLVCRLLLEKKNGKLETSNIEKSTTSSCVRT